MGFLMRLDDRKLKTERRSTPRRAMDEQSSGSTDNLPSTIRFYES